MVDCKVCGRTFAASDHLKQHVLASSKHSPEHLALCCRRCNSKVFISAISKQQHLLGSPKHHICALCPKHWDFETANQLKRHFKTKHLGHSPGDSQLIAEGLIEVTEIPRRKAALDPKPESHPNANQHTQVVPATTSPLDRFFASYPSFYYYPGLPPAASYQALVQHFGWGRRSEDALKAKNQYQEALRGEVDIWFGREDDLEAWHTLCRAVGVRRPPDTIKQCTHVLRNTHVNIVDLVQWGRNGRSEPVQLFKTQKELVDYSIENGKIFPSGEVQADGESNVVLRHLLRKFGRHADMRKSF